MRNVAVHLSTSEHLVLKVFSSLFLVTYCICPPSMGLLCPFVEQQKEQVGTSFVQSMLWVIDLFISVLHNHLTILAQHHIEVGLLIGTILSRFQLL